MQNNIPDFKVYFVISTLLLFILQEQDINKILSYPF